jgi:hypothetical protein
VKVRCGRIEIRMIWRYSVYFGGIGVLCMVARECRDWWMSFASSPLIWICIGFDVILCIGWR